MEGRFLRALRFRNRREHSHFGHSASMLIFPGPSDVCMPFRASTDGVQPPSGAFHKKPPSFGKDEGSARGTTLLYRLLTQTASLSTGDGSRILWRGNGRLTSQPTGKFRWVSGSGMYSPSGSSAPLTNRLLSVDSSFATGSRLCLYFCNYEAIITGLANLSRIF